MDAYAWYTINRESHDRLHERINEADGRRRLQRPQTDHSLQRSRLRLSVGEFLSAIGERLLGARPITFSSAQPGTGTTPAGDSSVIE